MTRTRATLLPAVLLPAVLLFATAARAEQSDSRLFELVGADAGLVIEVSGLKEEWPKLKNSEVLRRLRQTSMYRRWQLGPEYGRLAASAKAIEGLVRKPLGQFLSDLLGRSVVLAVYSSADDESRTVFLTRASSSTVLDAAIEAWDRAERAESQTISFAGHAYVRRTKSAPGEKAHPPQFYVRFDDVFALSDSEPAIRRVIERRLDRPNAGATAEEPKIDDGPKNFLSTTAFRDGGAALSPERFVSVYLNPRVWKGVVADDVGKSTGERMSAELWRRCDWIVFGLRADGGVVVEMTAQLDGADLSESWSQTVEAMSGPPEFLDRVPRRAAVVAVGRHDLAGAANLLASRIPPDKRGDWNRLRQIGRGLMVGFDLFDDVLPALGTGWGMYVVPRRAASAESIPADGLFAVELPPEGQIKRGQVTLRDGLDNALTTGLHLLGGLKGVKKQRDPATAGAADQAGGEFTVHSDATERGRLRWMDAGGPVRPAYAITPAYLAAGSSPEAVREFMALRPDESLASDPVFRRWSGQFFARENQLLFVDVGKLLGLVRGNRSELARRLAASKSIGLEEAESRIARFVELMGTFDAVFLAGRVERDRVRLVCGIAVR